MEIKHLIMAIRALRVMDHKKAPDWADKAEDELKAFFAERNIPAAQRIETLEAALRAIRRNLAKSRTSGIGQENRNVLIADAEELARTVLA